MDFELNEDQRAFADTARQFAQAELAPHAAHWDAEGIFPVEAIAKAGELGFCGLYAPALAMASLGKMPSASQCAACGANSAWANCRAVSAKARWSSLSSKSIQVS